MSNRTKSPEETHKKGKKSEEDKNAPEPGKQFVIPEPKAGTFTLDDIPNALETFETNIRSVKPVGAETPLQAIDRVLGIDKLMIDIERSAPGMMGAIEIGEWDEPPKWLKNLASEGRISYQGFKSDGKKVVRCIIDGNRREMALRRLAAKHPKGVEVPLKTHDDRGELVETKVHKTFESFPVLVYHGLTHDQLRQLQLVRGSRKNYRRGDIAKAGIELIQNNPLSVSESDLEAHLGSENRLALSGADKFHGKAQEIRRAALMPKDVTSAYIDYLNNEPGVNHPGHGDLRELFPAFKSEVASWDGGKFVPGRFYDPSFSIKTMTSDELETLWRQWTPAQCKAVGLDDGVTPADKSEFLAKWKSMRGAPKQARKQGIKVDQAEMSRIEGGYQANGAQVEAELVKMLRGAPDAVDKDKIINFVAKFSAWRTEVAKTVEPEKFKAFMDEFRTILASAVGRAPVVAAAAPAASPAEKPKK